MPTSHCFQLQVARCRWQKIWLSFLVELEPGGRMRESYAADPRMLSRTCLGATMQLLRVPTKYLESLHKAPSNKALLLKVPTSGIILPGPASHAPYPPRPPQPARPETYSEICQLTAPDSQLRGELRNSYTSLVYLYWGNDDMGKLAFHTYYKISLLLKYSEKCRGFRLGRYFEI